MYHKVEIALSAAVAALCVGAAEYDVAAYVWPAYHNEPRWKELGLFADGKGEWQNVYEAKPKWDGHRQPLVPLWGYENEADPKVVEKKIDAAVSHGVNVFIYDWYWYGGRPFLEDALDKGFLGAPSNGKMKFFIMWANHHVNWLWDNKVEDKKWEEPRWRSWVSAEEFKTLTKRWMEKYFSRPNYYRIGGKPVLMIYEVGTFVEGVGGVEAAAKALSDFRDDCAKAGLGGAHLMVCDYKLDPAQLKRLGVDSATIYNFVHWSDPNGNPDYAKWAAKGAERFDAAQKELCLPCYFAHASVGWDTNPRYPASCATPTAMDSTPAKFEASLRRAKAWCDANTPEGCPKLITVNSWNEWTEGSYLEPDTHFKFGYLEAVKRVFGSAVMGDAYWKIWNDVVQAGIDANIEKNRKADGAFAIDAPDGTDVKVEQISHAFQFGSHIFNFDQLGRDDWNDIYKATFTNLWNAATVAFYWKSYEPAQGKFRFAPGPHDGAAFWNSVSSLTPAEKRDLFPEYRRPAPDPIVDFCERNGISAHGHVMVYRSWQPEWVGGGDPKDPAVIAKYEAHIRELARHYGRRIDQWDVVNESCRRDASPSAPDDAVFWENSNGYPVPPDYTFQCFKAAERFLDPAVKMAINEAYTIDEVYLAFVKSLIDRGAKIDVVGLQYHIFNAKEMRDLARGEHRGRRGYCYTPERIMQTLANADRLGRPIHISEITIPAPEDTAWGHEVQAQVLRDLYRLWFSWPSVYRITYWNLVDYTSAKESLSSGFYTKEMKKKPVWHMMDDLLNREWRTRLTVKASGGRLSFRGFKGRYRLTWRDAGGTERSTFADLR